MYVPRKMSLSFRFFNQFNQWTYLLIVSPLRWNLSWSIRELDPVRAKCKKIASFSNAETYLLLDSPWCCINSPESFKNMSLYIPSCRNMRIGHVNNSLSHFSPVRIEVCTEIRGGLRAAAMPTTAAAAVTARIELCKRSFCCDSFLDKREERFVRCLGFIRAMEKYEKLKIYSIGLLDALATRKIRVWQMWQLNLDPCEPASPQTILAEAEAKTYSPIRAGDPNRP